MNEIDIGQPSCYKIAYKDENSKNLVISFTPAKGYFLYNNDLGASKLCVASTNPNYYIFNPGLACMKIIDFLKDKEIDNIICIGSSKAGLASLLWGHILKDKLPDTINVYALSFSPQTQLYPFNEALYFPSYHSLWSVIESNKGMKNCAKNYGDVNSVLRQSKLKGMIIYPEHNPCDKDEAERVQVSGIELVPIDYPLHGSFLPFMKQSKNDGSLQKMVEKIYANALKDDDVKATIPASAEELFNIIKSINAPTIEELCQAIFFKMSHDKEVDNFMKVRELGFVK